MCTYSVRINDNVMNRLRPHFNGEKAMQLWIEKLLQRVLVSYTEQFDVNGVENEDSTDFLQRIKALDGDPDGFFKLKGFMADSKSTPEELLEEALSEKYGF